MPSRENSEWRIALSSSKVCVSDMAGFPIPCVIPACERDLSQEQIEDAIDSSSSATTSDTAPIVAAALAFTRLASRTVPFLTPIVPLVASNHTCWSNYIIPQLCGKICPDRAFCTADQVSGASETRRISLLPARHCDPLPHFRPRFGNEKALAGVVDHAHKPRRGDRESQRGFGDTRAVAHVEHTDYRAVRAFREFLHRPEDDRAAAGGERRDHGFVRSLVVFRQRKTPRKRIGLREEDERMRLVRVRQGVEPLEKHVFCRRFEGR